MNLFQIKICGITTPEDAINAMESGADAIGLNFYSKSPRFVVPSVAESIVESIAQRSEAKKNLKPVGHSSALKIVGVFVNMPVSRLIETTIVLDLDAIQLHGDEDPSIVSEIRRQLPNLERSIELVRAVRTRPVANTQAPANVATCDVAPQNIEAEMAAWREAGIDALLLDAAVPGEFGGTGKAIDWAGVPNLSGDVPLILAGGLCPDNVEQAIEISQAKAVDVASGVESKPGHKDRAKVSAFIASAKRAFSRLQK